MTLNETYEKLLKNLSRPLVFFIPREIVPVQFKELLDDPEADLFLNKLKVLNQKGEIKNLTSIDSLLTFIEKATLLDQNLFLLIEEGKHLEKGHFKLLLKKYNEHLVFYCNTSGWLSNNLKSYFPKIELEIQNYFTQQWEFFTAHKSTFNSSFATHLQPGTNPMKVIEYLEENVNKKSLGAIITFKPLPVPDKPQKKSLITDKEATNLLLETVFNVKV